MSARKRRPARKPAPPRSGLLSGRPAYAPAHGHDTGGESITDALRALDDRAAADEAAITVIELAERARPPSWTAAPGFAGAGIGAMEPAPPPPAAAPAGAAPIGEATARGWPHLLALRCAYPAAPGATPIPCGAEHRDSRAGSFRTLRASARAAGWRMDAFARWACPACAQADPAGQYRTLYPLTLYARGAHEARQQHLQCEMITWPDARVITVPADHALAAMAEHELIRDVRDAAVRGRHAAVTR